MGASLYCDGGAAGASWAAGACSAGACAAGASAGAAGAPPPQAASSNASTTSQYRNLYFCMYILLCRMYDYRWAGSIMNRLTSAHERKCYSKKWEAGERKMLLAIAWRVYLLTIE
ncbi:MAG: hypothetical protein DCC55_26000 [Chloroflexi bacterium]|nr:MAG: hypothetical protein DCC55_26000 [Chloroflexota bacterium]